MNTHTFPTGDCIYSKPPTEIFQNWEKTGEPWGSSKQPVNDAEDQTRDPVRQRHYFLEHISPLCKHTFTKKNNLLANLLYKYI